jgi:hypothetical protein
LPTAAQLLLEATIVGITKVNRNAYFEVQGYCHSDPQLYRSFRTAPVYSATQHMLRALPASRDLT